MGWVYIPPEFSKYSSDQSFSEVEDELIHFSTVTEQIALIGDFNARTSNDRDFVMQDEKLLKYLNPEDDEFEVNYKFF